MGFGKYIKAAWKAKLGMPIPASWFIIAFTGVLAYFDPAYILIGVGVMSAYILILANSKVLQAEVSHQEQIAVQQDQLGKINLQVKRLNRDDKDRYGILVSRCQTIIKQQVQETPQITLQDQAVGLSRLANFYLQLLLSKEAIENAPVADDAPSLVKMIKAVERKLNAASLSPDLKRSYEQQLDLLHQRQKTQVDAGERHEFLEAELQRIEQHIELLREQTVADTSPTVVSSRIDTATSELTGTNDWMKKHRDLIGSGVEDLLSVPPPIVQTQEI